jgi:hypothetical protein
MNKKKREGKKKQMNTFIGINQSKNQTNQQKYTPHFFLSLPFARVEQGFQTTREKKRVDYRERDNR